MNMTDLKFNIDQAALQQALIDAVIKSALGGAIEKVIAEAMGVNRYDSPVKKAIDEVISRTVREVMQEKYAEKIKQAAVGG